MEALGLLHNFFDTFSQWLNFSLLGEKALPIRSVSMEKIAQQLPKYPEYASDFVSSVTHIPESSSYQYIADFNNTLKHRRQIYVNNRFDVFSVSGTVSIPSFIKDTRVHTDENILTFYIPVWIFVRISYLNRSNLLHSIIRPMNVTIFSIEFIIQKLIQSMKRKKITFLAEPR